MNNAVVSEIAKRSLPTLARSVRRQRLILRKQSPHIFFVAGVVGSVTSTVLACRATLKLPDALTEIEGDIDTVKQLKNENKLPEGYTEKDLNRDTVLAYSRAVYRLTRLYAPAIGVGTVSIVALSGSHIAMSRRNTALMAAYTTLSEAYANYRERVIAELGAERELDIYHSTTKVVNTDGDEVNVSDPNTWSPYARFFDEGSTSFEKNAELNRLFITCQQNWANEMLRARGHVFLNEVYDMLGFERTPEGAVVGWVIGGDGDDYIDFGMYEARNARFINGLERVPLLDFNVDGVVYDKI